MTKEEYLKWRKAWGKEYKQLADAIGAAKLQVRTDNSWWCRTPSAFNKVELGVSRLKLKMLRLAHGQHKSKLLVVKRENILRYEAEKRNG